MGPAALLPPTLREVSSAMDFITLKNPSPSTGFEPTNFWSNGKDYFQRTWDKLRYYIPRYLPYNKQT
jgi:hypothetical protein